jgi:hypothetical protein
MLGAVLQVMGEDERKVVWCWPHDLHMFIPSWCTYYCHGAAKPP